MSNRRCFTATRRQSRYEIKQTGCFLNKFDKGNVENFAAGLRAGTNEEANSVVLVDAERREGEEDLHLGRTVSNEKRMEK
jgi:uncharacterized protein YkvS